MKHRPVALITGGARRIGKAFVMHLADKGYDIAFSYQRSLKEAKVLEKYIQSKGLNCYLLKCDFSNLTEVSGLLSKLKKINLLINNASIYEPATFKKTKNDSLVRHININLLAPFILAREFARLFGKGHIINLLDARISHNQSDYAAYTLSKKALFELTKMAAHEFAPEIRVNAIAPGLILPPPGEKDYYLLRKVKDIPLRMRGDLDHLLKGLDYLCDNDFVTGQCLFIDGGEHLK